MTPFEKWEGTGNDFIVVAEEHLSVADAAKHAPAWCDRHFGVGADGILIVGRRPKSMTVINADGSRPEMCGNGIRIVAAAFGEGVHTIRTDAGVLECAAARATADLSSSDSAPWMVSVSMGTIDFTPAASHVEGPVDGEGPWSLPSVEVGSSGYIASAGNPHWVFVDVAVPSAEACGRMENDRRFTQRTNVEFVRPLGGNEFELVVWERGCGFTLACGTGAAATAAVLAACEHADPAHPVTVHLPGGPLQITVDTDARATMTGPARKVYVGVLP